MPFCRSNLVFAAFVATVASFAASAFGSAGHDVAFKNSRVHAIDASGRLWGWGDNYFNLVSTDCPSICPAPTQIHGSARWIAVASGASSTVAIKTDSTLWSWGIAYDGNGIPYQQNVPIQMSVDSGWRSVAAGDNASYAIKNDGSLWAWGLNSSGQVGDGTTLLRARPVRIGQANDWTSVSAGIAHVLALKADRSLWAWGDNSFYQVSAGASTSQLVPYRVGSETDWISIAAGSNFSLAERADYSLWGWGANFYGQLGINTAMRDVFLPTQIPLTGSGPWRSVSAATTHTTAVRGDGTLWAWGANDLGQLGTSTLGMSNSPVRVGSDSDWSRAIAASGTTLAIRVDGAFDFFGANSKSEAGVDYSGSSSPVAIAAAFRWKEVSAGVTHTAAIDSDGALWIWGRDAIFPYTGSVAPTYRNQPTRMGFERWRHVAAGSVFTLAIREDGTLWHMGDRFFFGQTTSYAAAPQQVGTDSDWIEVDARFAHAHLLKRDGSLWAIGDDSYGALGIGTSNYSFAPVRVGSESNWVRIRSSGYGGFAVKQDGSLWGWGFNQTGALGLGTYANVRVPTLISSIPGSSHVAQGGFSSAYALRGEGSLWRSASALWTQVGNGADWRQISVGMKHVALLKSDGSAWLSGENDFGQLGLGRRSFGTSETYYFPGKLPGYRWSDISVGGSHTVAIRDDGSLWGWGSNAYGQLGQGVDPSLPRRSPFRRNGPVLGFVHNDLEFFQEIGGSPGQYSMRLESRGPGDSVIFEIPSLSAPFSSTHNCPSVLSVGASCEVTIRFEADKSGSVATTQGVSSNALVDSAGLRVSANVSQQQCALDVDGDGRLLPFTDGLLILRYMLGLRGNALVANADRNAPPDRTAAVIEKFIAAAISDDAFDADGDRFTEVGLDAQILLRALVGYRNEAIFDGLGAPRQTAKRSRWADGPPGTNVLGYMKDRCNFY